MSSKVGGHWRMHMEWAHLGLTIGQELAGNTAVTIWLEKRDLCLQGLQPSVWNPWKFCYKHRGMMAAQCNDKLKAFPSPNSGKGKWNTYWASRAKGLKFLVMPWVPVLFCTSRNVTCRFALYICHSQSEFYNGNDGSSRKTLFKQWCRAMT